MIAVRFPDFALLPIEVYLAIYTLYLSILIEHAVSKWKKRRDQKHGIQNR